MEKTPVADIVCLLPDFQRQPETLTAVTKAEKDGGGGRGGLCVIYINKFPIWEEFCE